MTRFTDGRKILIISMYEQDENGKTPDMENDIFGVGGLQRDGENDAYIVDDVGYLIGAADDWKNFTGDFYADDLEKAEFAERGVNKIIRYDVYDLA